MKVKDVMTKKVYSTEQNETLASAARQMKNHDVGMLAVMSSDGKVVGTITDRDITVRGIARDLNPTNTSVKEAMTPGCEFCFEDDSIEDAAQHMRDKGLRRVVVVSKGNRKPSGVVSLGDLAVHPDSRRVAGEVLSQVATRSKTAAHHR